MECSTFPYLSTSAAPRRQREWQEQNLLFLIDLTMNLADQRSRLTAPLMHACMYIYNQSNKQENLKPIDNLVYMYYVQHAMYVGT